MHEITFSRALQYSLKAETSYERLLESVTVSPETPSEVSVSEESAAAPVPAPAAVPTSTSVSTPGSASVSTPAPASARAPYQSLSPIMAVQLAAPHTWPAAVMPALVATAAACADGFKISVSLTVVLLLICILMQASVNTFNDYHDYVKGADSKENQEDPTDAVLVYNNINPKSALYLAIAFLVSAFALGMYVVYSAGPIPLGIGIFGAVIVVLYSGGKTPLSYLPVGELVSGTVMGCLIPLAVYFALTGCLSLKMVLLSLPCVCGVGLIMFTNNTCDIEKDIDAKRHTLPVVLGREKARSLYHAVVFTWLTLCLVLTGIFYTPGLILAPFMLISLYPALNALLHNPLSLQTRLAAMPQCLNLNIATGAFYTAMIVAGSYTYVVL